MVSRCPYPNSLFKVRRDNDGAVLFFLHLRGRISTDRQRSFVRSQQLRRGLEVAPGLRALRGHQRRTAFQRSAPMIVAAIRPSSPNGNSRAKIGAANKQNSTATPPVHSNVGLNLPEAKSVIAAASQQQLRFA